MRNISLDLKNMADTKYKKFSSSMIPNAKSILGVRAPKMKQYTKTFTIQEALDYIDNYKTKYFEEILLKVLLLSKFAPKLETQKNLKYMQILLPHLTNWALCDTFCSYFKIVAKHQDNFWPYILKCLKSKEEFIQRFAFVILLKYYLTPAYIDDVLQRALTLRPTTYYAQMGQAWLACECYIKYKNKTGAYLKLLSAPVLKMTTRKLKDSFRVEDF